MHPLVVVFRTDSKTILVYNMTNKIDKERRHSMNTAPTRPTNKRQRQGAQEDPKEKQDRAQVAH
jgi:hypothetical protein